jgi:SPOR domain
MNNAICEGGADPPEGRYTRLGFWVSLVSCITGIVACAFAIAQGFPSAGPANPSMQSSHVPLPPPTSVSSDQAPGIAGPQIWPEIRIAADLVPRSIRVVQFASEDTQQSAQDVIVRLRKDFPDVVRNLEHRIQVAKVTEKGATKTKYRALMGPFSTRDEAVNFCARLEGSKCVPCDWCSSPTVQGVEKKI